MTLSTPIIFLIFRRPDLTQKVFERIRAVRPKTLFVVADGPRSPEEADLCTQARAVIDQVDWPCDVYKNYAETNLGCKKRVSSGISWAFEHTEEAIILEDDCLPTLTFFTFCETLLDYYRNDERVFMISGNNFQDGICRSPYSYYFSKYTHVWGWATWKRAWGYWGDDPKKWSEFKEAGLLKSWHPDPLEYNYWQAIFDNIFYRQQPDTWDYLWTFTCWSQGGLTILPCVNLVTNLGFRYDATHTHNPQDKNANLPTADLEQIIHPPFVVMNTDADRYTFQRVFCPPRSNAFNRWSRRLSRWKKKIFSLLALTRGNSNG
ncbi:MAG: hypothetical protein NZL92_02100 [Gloeomargarita sp. SKYG116]|nr:hypothetical protein [Gloeomargarita sp. SKYG116]MDW8400471.1 hypothetical protein [Gloeomargarita sp. SKYGB_i_bin116]